MKMRFDRFFSYWGLGAHALYALGVFPNTFPVALFVLMGAIFHNLFLNKSYNIWFDFVLHWAPFLVFIVLFWFAVLRFHIGLKEIAVPVVLLALYLLYVGGLDKSLEYYSDHVYWFSNS